MVKNIKGCEIVKKMFLPFIIGSLFFALAACEEQPEDDGDQNGSNGDSGEDRQTDHEIKEEDLNTLTDMLELLDDAYEEWEGKKLVNSVEVPDPASSSEDDMIDVQTRIYSDASGDRLYVETLNMSEEEPETLNYLYMDEDKAYSFESAEFKSGEDTEDTYETLHREDVENQAPNIDDMFSQTLQFFPSDKDLADMQGMILMDAAIQFDEDDETYAADVDVLMETQTGQQNEEVWSIEGDSQTATIEMPIPSLGTVTFGHIDFEEEVEPIDKSLHPSEPEEKDDEEEN